MNVSKKANVNIFQYFFPCVSNWNIAVLLLFIHSPKGLFGTPVQFLINAII